MDGHSVRSCLMLAVQAAGAEITTVEGLGTPEALNVLQAHSASITACSAVLHARHADDGRGSAPQISARNRRGDPGRPLRNLCRCTGYQNIVAAIRSAAAIRREDVR
jgi:carbon-monoxide dehydrogenase small subunit